MNTASAEVTSSFSNWSIIRTQHKHAALGLLPIKTLTKKVSGLKPLVILAHDPVNYFYNVTTSLPQRFLDKMYMRALKGGLPFGEPMAGIALLW